MGRNQSRRRRTRIFCGFSGLLLALIIGCGLVYAAEEELPSRIEWDYNAERNVFTVYNAAEVFPEAETVRCIMGFYEESGRMLFSAAAVQSGGALEVQCPAAKLPLPCTVRMCFLSGDYAPLGQAEVYQISSTEPTCTKNGYLVAEREDGSDSKVLQVYKAPGHSIRETVLQAPPDAVTCGTMKRWCENCSFAEQVPVYPECDIARLCLYGDLTGIGKKAEVPVTVTFEGAGKELDCYALLKYQGHTSLIYDKKNYTLKLFKDAAFAEKNKIVFFDWNKEHKYILKANYIDPSVCRNLVCADIWSEMVACRENYPARLADSSNFGATDGFPMALYLNDTYQGLYTFTLHRDDDLFDMEDGNLDGIVVTNTAQTDAAFFRAPATFDDQSDWEVEYTGLEDDSLWLEQKLNTLIDFVQTSSDEEFRENLDEYLDVNSAIDYLIAIYSLGLTNSGAKNITMATYDDGLLFFSLCDMENAFGLSATGEEILDPSEVLPVCTDGVWDSATGSLLWDRLLQNYETEIRARYTELRREILTAERICTKVSDFLQPISEEFYAADRQIYPDMPHPTEFPQKQIEEYVPQRLSLLDGLLLSPDTE